LPDAKKPTRLWALVTLVLIAVIITGAGIAGARYHPAGAIEISLPAEAGSSGNISISGAVINQGIYPYASGDTIDSLLKAAGGTTTSGDQTTLTLTVPEKGGQNAPQKININRAETWLLEALPGIGVTRAKTIVAYRELHGPFKNTAELMNVEGIGQSIFDQIKDLITVSD
jgi:competence protein ComEA